MEKETKYISETEYLRFKQQFQGIWISMLIGACVGFFLARQNEVSALETLGYCYACACIPYSWKVTPLTAIGCLSAIFKLFICCIFGWILAPVMLIYSFVQVKRYETALEQHLIEEKAEEDKKRQYEDVNIEKLITAIDKGSNESSEEIIKKEKEQIASFDRDLPDI